MKKTGAEIFVQVLLEQGVDTLFGYPGGAVLHLYDALYRSRGKIRHIMTAHEQGAAHAADGYARATGKTGVVLATSGPGATNLVTGIAAAYMDSIPMVAITGNVGTHLIGRDSFQEVFITGITMPITKHNFVVRRVEELAHTLREAFRIAQSGRKGPVLVDIPKDITFAKTEYTPVPAVTPAPPPIHDPNALLQAAQLINNARRPLFCLGGGVASSGARALILQLLQKTQIPAVHTLMASCVLDRDEPLNLGLIGMHGNNSANQAVHACDLLIAIGTRFSDRVTQASPHFAENAVRIQIDIDASEISKNVEIDCGIVGDAAAVLRDLLPLLHSGDHPDWLARLHQWQNQDPQPQGSSQRLTPWDILRICSDLAPADSVYVTDVGQHQLWTCKYLRHVQERCLLTSGGLGAMGFGYGAALGAQAALGQHRTVLMLTGDGSFHMNMTEACTAVSYDLPVITILFNNGVLGMVRQMQATAYQGRYASTEPHRKTDYLQVAKGFGVDGYRCKTPQEFYNALSSALSRHRPTWIECIIDKEEQVLPMLPSDDGSAEAVLS